MGVRPSDDNPVLTRLPVPVCVQEVRDMKRELAESESRMHWLSAQRDILEAQKQMADQEAKLYTDKGKGKSRRDQLQVRLDESTQGAFIDCLLKQRGKSTEHVLLMGGCSCMHCFGLHHFDS